MFLFFALRAVSLGSCARLGIAATNGSFMELDPLCPKRSFWAKQPDHDFVEKLNRLQTFDRANELDRFPKV